ncbi:alpha/beta fold hydrolase [Nocardioides sp.]|uniref:alpha/beta hydrolase n=1 Tax=Nocardioides sp. TaxID=35761 RepID=UPI002636BA3F|nr:alpha/beta fold hydrolase [Nocardioides sp.]
MSSTPATSAASTTSPVRPTAVPLSLPARPDQTGGLKVGVLLSHGFTGSPGSMRPWGEAMAAHGYAVEVPRLPGHGTTWQEMNTTTWDQWLAEITATFRRLRAENDHVVVCGLSMGGALVLRVAELFPDEVDGVVLVNPGVATTRWDVKLLPVLKHIVPALKGVGSDIKKQGVVEDAYPHTPLKAAHSMFRGWRTVAADLERVTAPLLYFRSTIDHVVDEASEPLIRGRVSSTDVTFTPLRDSYHVATVDNDAPQIFAESADFVARVCGLPTSA